MKVLRRIGISVLLISFLGVGLCYGQGAEMYIALGIAEQRLTKGVEYGAQGKFKKATGEFENALKVDPSSEVAKEALKVIEDVIGEKIKSETAIHLFKGLACVIKVQLGEAIAEYSNAIEINPRYPEAYCGRGFAYLHKGQYNKAISDFNKAIEINPKHAASYWGRGVTYLIRGQFNKAISDHDKALR